MEAMKHLLNKDNVSRSLIGDSKTGDVFASFDGLAGLKGFEDLSNEKGIENKFKQFFTTKFKDTKLFNDSNIFFSMQQIFSSINRCHQQPANSISHSTPVSNILIQNPLINAFNNNITLLDNLIQSIQKDHLNSFKQPKSVEIKNGLDKDSENKKVESDVSKDKLISNCNCYENLYSADFSAQNSTSGVLENGNVVKKICEIMRCCGGDLIANLANGIQQNITDIEADDDDDDDDNGDDDDSDDADIIWDDWDDDDDVRYIGLSDCLTLPTIYESLRPVETFSDVCHRKNNPFLTQKPSPTSPPSSNSWQFSDWNSGIDDEIKNLPFGSPSPQTDEIIIIMQEDEQEDERSDDVRIANSHWQQQYSSPIPDQLKSPKVHFKESQLIHSYDDEGVDRKGPWEEMARDCSRFRRRILSLSPILSPILHPNHRTKILSYICSKHSELQTRNNDDPNCNLNNIHN